MRAQVPRRFVILGPITTPSHPWKAISGRSFFLRASGPLRETRKSCPTQTVTRRTKLGRFEAERRNDGLDVRDRIPAQLLGQTLEQRRQLRRFFEAGDERHARQAHDQ